MLVTDLGLLAYWVATATRLIAPYPAEVLVDWNWSFLGLDVMVSVTGLAGLWLLRRGSDVGRWLMPVSLALTHAAGLTALNFWVLRGEYALGWWLPNLWLAVFPVVALVVLWRSSRTGRSVSPARTSIRPRRPSG
ncbi:DUF5360 family protein [Phytomonospora endophytica]|nr:DUF5360 family protein [Phytomonospora endophytica]GIG64666.1 hypothetical protein Pen01_09610 [Phytomonospora endophytica]